jgi:hypothetical protein
VYTLYKLNVLLYCLEVNEDEVIGLSGSVQCLSVETEIMLLAGANLALMLPFRSGMAMQTPFESSDVPCVGGSHPLTWSGRRTSTWLQGLP